MHFSPKIRHIPLPCENCDIKNERKQVKKFGQPWLTLTVQFSYVFSLLLFLRACQAKELTISLSLSFFIVPRWRLGQDRLRKMKKASSVYRLRQSTKDEKVRALALRRNAAEKPRGMRLKFVLSQLRTCTHENKNMFVFFKSWARVSRVQPRKTRWSQF